MGADGDRGGRKCLLSEEKGGFGRYFEIFLDLESNQAKNNIEFHRVFGLNLTFLTFSSHRPSHTGINRLESLEFIILLTPQIRTGLEPLFD